MENEKQGRQKTQNTSKKYSRTPVTRTLKGSEKQFELAGGRVIGVDWIIQFAVLIIDSLLIFQH